MREHLHELRVAGFSVSISKRRHAVRAEDMRAVLDFGVNLVRTAGCGARKRSAANMTAIGALPRPVSRPESRGHGLGFFMPRSLHFAYIAADVLFTF
jgi:hypothetical protein